MAKMRISKLLSLKGICSRRQAEEWISNGWVQVDGETITTLYTQVEETSEIKLSSEALQAKKSLYTVALNKPLGVISNLPQNNQVEAKHILFERNFVGDHIPDDFDAEKLSVAGRLDIHSKGLLILTQDGALAKRLIGENSELEKEYVICTKEPYTKEQLKRLEYGLKLDGKPLKRAKIRALKPTEFLMVLKEGRNRQIRRMCELVGLEVTSLLRTRIGNLRLKTLQKGQWKFISPDEI